MPPLPYRIRADLFTHLAAMENAGLSPTQAFSLLVLPGPAGARLAAFRRQFARRHDAPAAGLASGLFTALETRLVRAALAAGSPAATYRRLGASYDAKATQLAAIRARMMLPVAILGTALFVNPLPALLGGAIGPFGYLARAAGPLLLLAALAAAALRLPAAFLSGDTGPARRRIERLLLATPRFGPMHARRNARDFVDNLAMLLAAGLPMFDAVPVALSTMNNSILRADFARLLPALRRGATFAAAVSLLDTVDADRLGRLHGLVVSGEASGTLPEMLTRYADAETAAIDAFQDQLAQWLPRLFYGAVSLWMASRMLAPPPPLPDL